MHACVYTGVNVADDDALAELGLPPGRAAGDAVGAGEPQELPRPRRVQLLLRPVREHRHHLRQPCMRIRIIKNIPYNLPLHKGWHGFELEERK